MKQIRNMLLLAVSLMLLLSLVASPTSAARDLKRGGWFGFQVSDPTQPGIIVFRQGYVEVYGAGMIVTKGYVFGDVKVVYEKIDYMRIEIDISTLNLNEPVNIYSYPHYGVFTWFKEVDGKRIPIGTGTFESKGGPPYGGDLRFSGSGLVVEGKYRVIRWTFIDYYGLIIIKYPVLLAHGGTWYTE